MNELVQWFKESDGFMQGTKAPHKWVLQAEQELRYQDARIKQLEYECDALRAEVERLLKALAKIANGDPTVDIPETEAQLSAAIANAAMKGASYECN